jgi:hypothetical protein
VERSWKNAPIVLVLGIHPPNLRRFFGRRVNCEQVPLPPEEPCTGCRIICEGFLCRSLGRTVRTCATVPNACGSPLERQCATMLLRVPPTKEAQESARDAGVSKGCLLGGCKS